MYSQLFLSMVLSVGVAMGILDLSPCYMVCLFVCNIAFLINEPSVLLSLRISE